MHVARFPVAELAVPVPVVAPSPAAVPRRRSILRREVIFGAVLLAADAVGFTALYLGLLLGRPAAGAQLGPLLLCLVSLFIVLTAIHGYSLRTAMGTARFAAEHGLACLMAAMLALLFQFAVFLFDLSRSRLVLLLAFLAFTPLSLLVRRVLSRALGVRTETQSFLILGAGDAARAFLHTCRAHGTAQQLRFVDPSGHRAGERLDGPGSPVIECGRWDDLAALIDERVEAVVTLDPFPRLAPACVDALVQTHFRDAPILTLESFHERYWRQIPVIEDPAWGLRHDFRLARDSSYCVFKRAMDLLLASTGLVLALPLLLACALAILLDSGGPVLYCQRRIRCDREPFTLYKLRTMRPGGEAGLYTCAGDARVTRVGHWLRRLRLDELPQLWNVLRGDMSLIGPRAEWDRCACIYEREIPCYHFRHLVRPGITGWAQVNYPYGQSVADAAEKLKYDLDYIKNYSLLLDASIVLKTIYVMLSCQGR